MSITVDIADDADFCQTFDDGPTDATAMLLDYLDSVNQKTTFFELGSRVVDNYLVTQRGFASGHQIAGHTWSHPNLTSLTNEQIYAELQWTIYAIHAAIGQIPKYFRPPYGYINDNVRRVAAQLNLTVIPFIPLLMQAIIWNRDSNDWQIGSNPKYTYQSVVNATSGLISLKEGTILLEHDLRPVTVQVAQAVSQMILKAGDRINCPIAALFGDAHPYQGTKLTWPVVENNTFDPSFNPVKGTVR